MPEPVEGGPATEAEYDAHKAAKPDGGEADDGKQGGQSMGGRRGPASAASDGVGINAQSGGKSGSESERGAPGMSTDKKADDTR